MLQVIEFGLFVLALIAVAAYLTALELRQINRLEKMEPWQQESHLAQEESLRRLRVQAAQKESRTEQ